jgi:hypothetical protein
MGTSNDADIHAGTKAWIRDWCRKFTPDAVDWDNASEPSEKYNCMGFAVGVLKWWQKRDISDGINLTPQYNWIDGVREEDDIESFVALAEAMGFQRCDENDQEEGSEKIILCFRDDKYRPFMHAVLHIAAGRFKSKLAEHSDIEHPDDAFNDVSHWIPMGRVYMKRRPEKKLEVGTPS